MKEGRGRKRDCNLGWRKDEDEREIVIKREGRTRMKERFSFWENERLGWKRDCNLEIWKEGRGKKRDSNLERRKDEDEREIVI